VKKTILLILLAFLIFNGCVARINKAMSSWENHHYSDLIASWGPPQQVFDDGQGGRILVYAIRRQWTSPGKSTTRTIGSATIWDDYIWGSATTITSYKPPETYGYTAHRMFWITRDGIIYRWAWRGL